jgi:uncharacterized phage protein gp47/JayE
VSFGITIDGFNLKRLSDILDEIEKDQKTAFGDIDVSESSVYGQLNGTFANQCAAIWEVLEQDYLSTSPRNAEGLSLDYVMAQNGISRLPSLPTVVNIGLQGTISTVVPAGTQARNAVTNELFELTNDTTITNQDLNQIFIAVETVIDFDTYTITINSTVYNIVAGGISTPDSIAAQLISEINGDPTRVVDAINLGDGYIQIDSNDSLSFDTAITSNLGYYTPSSFESINTGALLALENTINIIETPVSGLDAINNFIDGIKGRDEETDVEARLRREESFQVAGGGTLPAIVARILNEVEGVIKVIGYENRTDFTDGDGRPPHSIEIIIVGGTDQDVADKLWLVKGGGINTYGNTPIDITDSNGDLQTMNFTRPVDVDIWLKATLTLYSEEIFPIDGEDQVKQQMLDYGNTLDIGEDVIAQRFLGPIFEIAGIQNIVMEISKDAPPPYTGGAIIAIAAGEVGAFDLARIEVDIP